MSKIFDKEFIQELKKTSSILFLLGLILAILPGLSLVFIFDKWLFINLAIIKLLLISLAISGGLYIFMFICYDRYDSFVKAKEQHKNLSGFDVMRVTALVSLVNCFFVTTISIGILLLTSSYSFKKFLLLYITGTLLFMLEVAVKAKCSVARKNTVIVVTVLAVIAALIELFITS